MECEQAKIPAVQKRQRPGPQRGSDRDRGPDGSSLLCAVYRRGEYRLGGGDRGGNRGGNRGAGDSIPGPAGTAEGRKSGVEGKIDDYNNNVQTYQDMRDAFKWEQWDMESKAEDMKDSDAAASSIYASNAAMLKSSARNMYKQIDKMTGEKSTRSLEKEADSLTMAAQALMNSYNQMAVNARAKAKTAEAALAACEAVKARYSIGSATLADVQAAEQRLTNARNAAASMEEQAAQLKADLLLLLGMEPGARVEIGAVPAPDLEAIAAIDVEADRNKALGNNSSVLSARHAKAVGTAAQNRREKQVNQAEGEAEADLNSLYQTVVEKRTAYEGAAASWESAQIIYNSLLNKQSAGMLTNTEYLEGEASYLENRRPGRARPWRCGRLTRITGGRCWGCRRRGSK